MRIFFMSVFVLLMFCSCNNSKYSKEDYTKTRVKRIANIKENIQEAKTVRNNVDSLSIEKSVIKFHIIIASTTNKRTAIALANSYKSKGYNAKLIQSGKSYRLSIDSYKTKDAANNAKETYIKDLNKKDIWILPF